MKKLLSLIVITSLLFVSCSDGEPGPPGQDGLDGLDGVNIVGQAFEVEVDFVGDEYSIFADIPGNIEVLDSDIVLVYWLEAVEDGADVWSMLPQTFYFDDGQFQYNYNHTAFDVNIYLQGNIDLGTLGDAYTQDQIFKIVVLPVDYATNASFDVSNFNELKEAVNIQELDVRTKVH
jgi:hypothetical protein